MSHNKKYVIDLNKAKRFLFITLLLVFVIAFMLGYFLCMQTSTATALEEVQVIQVTEPVIECSTTEQTPEVIPLGICKLTAYCGENYPHICNDGDATKTATGVRPTVGRTVAVDPNVIPYGSTVIIGDHEYIAEDCGGAIKENRIDIFFDTHKEALAFGVQYSHVSYIKPIEMED